MPRDSNISTRHGPNHLARDGRKRPPGKKPWIGRVRKRVQALRLIRSVEPETATIAREAVRARRRAAPDRAYHKINRELQRAEQHDARQRRARIAALKRGPDGRFIE